jgi:hypothetical protein
VLGHSIIINGECASGKTETARTLLHHLLRHSSAGAVSGPEREQAVALTEKIVQANVLLEALGSARLCRNYNSRYETCYVTPLCRAGADVGSLAISFLFDSPPIPRRCAFRTDR